jgi:hypothetical protein
VTAQSTEIPNVQDRQDFSPDAQLLAIEALGRNVQMQEERCSINKARKLCRCKEVEAKEESFSAASKIPTSRDTWYCTSGYVGAQLPHVLKSH